MSENAQGPGWWQASDGRWYPPEAHPNYMSPTPPPPPPPLPAQPDATATPDGPPTVEDPSTRPWSSAGPGWPSDSSPGAPVVGDVSAEDRAKSPVWRRWWFVGIVAVVLIVGIVTAVGLGSDDASTKEDLAVVDDGTTPPADRDEGADGDPVRSDEADVPSGDTASDENDEGEKEAKSDESDTGPLPNDANPALGVQGVADLPDGESGELSIVAIGREESSLGISTVVPVVVRNRTGRTVSDISVSGSARDTSGSLIGSGSDQGFKPAVVGPGEIAIGYVYFNTGDVPGDATFDFDVSGTNPDDRFMSAVDLVVDEHNRTGDSVVVMLRNDTSEVVSGPISLLMMCFDSDGTPIGTESTFTDQNDVGPGATVSGSFTFWGDPPCERYILGGSGYDF